MDISPSLRLKQLGIDTHKEAVIYMHKNCHVCRSEGFEAPARINVALNGRTIIATLNIIDSDLLTFDEASLSIYAWDLLGANEGDTVFLSHSKPLHSLSYVRSKVYGNELTASEFTEIINDIVAGRFSDIHTATFLTSCAGGHMTKAEIFHMTDAMIHAGERIHWPVPLVVDKHCVGGLPGNRTSMLVVPIVAAFGLTIPKTSSRAITSPAGTADTMEVLAPVELDLARMRKVVEQENGCIIWGGMVTLSPADDIMIRVERAIDLDSEGQMVASILSKKIAAGSTHILIDIPIGPSVKVRSQWMADLLQDYLQTIGEVLGAKVHCVFTDGTQPVGRGIGPALEARDILAVLQGDPNAPQDLRERALMLAGRLLEFSTKVPVGKGREIATHILNSGRAWEKFKAICLAQGGLFEPPVATYTYAITAKTRGIVTKINNRQLARIAKFAGAPSAKAAGVEFLAPLGTLIEKDQPLFIIHAMSQGELNYALDYIAKQAPIVRIERAA